MVTSGQVKRVERLLNNRPVRKFNYKTLNQVLLEKIALITQTYNKKYDKENCFKIH
jgi:IS30 family transposase